MQTLTLTQKNKDVLKAAFTEAFEHANVPAFELNAIYTAILTNPFFTDILADAGEPYKDQCDRFGDFVYDPQGVAFKSVQNRGDFLYLKADQRRLYAGEETYRLTGRHVLKIVFDNENDCCFITPDGEMMDLEDTNDWYFVIIEDVEAAIEW